MLSYYEDAETNNESHIEEDGSPVHYDGTEDNESHIESWLTCSLHEDNENDNESHIKKDGSPVQGHRGQRGQ